MELTESHPPRTSAPRVTGWLALAGVSVIAGIASYFHALAVVQSAGAAGVVAYLVPALADLVILGASADLLAASRAGYTRPPLTMVALSVGIVVTLAMNVAAGWPHGWGSRLVAGWPALAFILALESLSGLVRRGRGGAGPVPAPAASTVAGGCGHGVADTLAERVVDAYTHIRVCLGAEPSYRDLGRAFGIHHDTAGQMVKAALEGAAAERAGGGASPAPAPGAGDRGVSAPAARPPRAPVTPPGPTAGGARHDVPAGTAPPTAQPVPAGANGQVPRG